MSEDKLNKNYIEEYNRLASKSEYEDKLTEDKFRICDVVGNCHMYMYLNGKVIGTPNRYKKMLSINSSLAEYIFALSIAKETNCEIYLEDILKIF